MDGVALASTITSGLVAIAGVGAAYLTSKSEREARANLSSAEFEHQRQLARDTRLFEERKGIYAQVSDILHHWLAHLNEIRLAQGNPGTERPERPEEVSWERFRVLRAALATFGSQKAVTAFDHFYDAARKYELVSARPANAAQTDERVAEAAEAYDGAKDRFLQLEQAIRADLTG